MFTLNPVVNARDNMVHQERCQNPYFWGSVLFSLILPAGELKTRFHFYVVFQRLR